MKRAVYDVATGEIVKVIICSSEDAALAQVGPGQALSEDQPQGNDREYIVDLDTGNCRPKKQNEKEALEQREMVMADIVRSKDEENAQALRGKIEQAIARGDVAELIFKAMRGEQI